MAITVKTKKDSFPTNPAAILFDQMVNDVGEQVFGGQIRVLLTLAAKSLGYTLANLLDLADFCKEMGYSLSTIHAGGASFYFDKDQSDLIMELLTQHPSLRAANHQLTVDVVVTDPGDNPWTKATENDGKRTQIQKKSDGFLSTLGSTLFKKAGE